MENGEKKSPGHENIPIGRVEYPKSLELVDIYASIAVIEKDGKFLVGKRPANKIYPGKWEFIGGKIELGSGETPESCVGREVAEEIGVLVEEVVPFLEWDYRMPDGKLHHLFAFRCKISGNCEKKVPDEIGWFTLEELAGLDFIESDKVLIDSLRNAQKKN